MRIFWETISDSCRKRPWLGLFMGFLVYLFTMMILLPAFFSFVMYFYELDQESLGRILQGEFLQSGDKNIFRLLQGGGQLLSWGIAAFIAANLVGDPWEVIKFRFDVPFVFFALAPLMILLSLPMVQSVTFDADSFRLPSVLSEWEASIHQKELRSQQILGEVLFQAEQRVLLLNLMIFALVPAICEELFFRGFLQHQLAKKVNIHLAIFLSALVFSLVHFQFYGFISRFLLGLILGYLVYGSGSILSAILAHFCFNSISILAMYQAANMGYSRDQAMELGERLPMGWAILSFFAVLALLILYLRLAKSYPNQDI